MGIRVGGGIGSSGKLVVTKDAPSINGRLDGPPLVVPESVMAVRMRVRATRPPCRQILG